MFFSWFSMGVSWFFHGFSMGSPCFFKPQPLPPQVPKATCVQEVVHQFFWKNSIILHRDETEHILLGKAQRKHVEKQQRCRSLGTCCHGIVPMELIYYIYIYITYTYIIYIYILYNTYYIIYYIFYYILYT